MCTCNTMQFMNQKTLKVQGFPIETIKKLKMRNSPWLLNSRYFKFQTHNHQGIVGDIAYKNTYFETFIVEQPDNMPVLANITTFW